MRESIILDNNVFIKGGVSMEQRRIMTNFRTLGRVFKNGDIVIIDKGKDNLIHIYTDDDSLHPEILQSPLSNIFGDHMNKLIGYSEVIE